MKVSVVVPALDEEEYIGACLEGIRAQSVDCELIVVDSGSSDDTVSIAGEYADNVLTGKRNIPFNRQLGLEACCGDVYVSTDADCVFPEGWLEALVSHFGDDEVVCVSGPTVPMEGSGDLDRLCYYAGNLFVDGIHRLGVDWFRGSNSGYLREKALEAGGYDTQLVAREDSDLSRRVSELGVTVFDWSVTVMTSMRRRENTGWLKTLKYYVDTPVSLLRGKSYYEKA